MQKHLTNPEKFLFHTNLRLDATISQIFITLKLQQMSELSIQMQTSIKFLRKQKRLAI